MILDIYYQTAAAVVQNRDIIRFSIQREVFLQIKRFPVYYQTAVNVFKSR